MASTQYRKVNRNQVFKEIVELIKKNEGEVEISSSELADSFNVQAPTMDYHLNKLVEEGRLSLSPKRGRYNRKIYRLPSNLKEEKVIKSYEDAEKFKAFLEQHMKKPQEKQVEQSTLEFDKPEQKTEPIQIKSLTLDDRINEFLEKANMVHKAQDLLSHQDKEILSVMNETIQQNIVYLKDLSEQLSTVQNKELIQHLIDDRNATQEEIKRLRAENEELRKQEAPESKPDLDPQRIRFMHQMIISTIDSFLNSPNHAMALGRNEFRDKVSKEVGDLVKYCLKLEK